MAGNSGNIMMVMFTVPVISELRSKIGGYCHVTSKFFWFFFLCFYFPVLGSSWGEKMQTTTRPLLLLLLHFNTKTVSNNHKNNPDTTKNMYWHRKMKTKKAHTCFVCLFVYQSYPKRELANGYVEHSRPGPLVAARNSHQVLHPWKILSKLTRFPL